MPRIRAAVCHAFNEPLRIEEVDLRPPAAGEVMVRLQAVAICHSDIAFAEGAWGGTLPAVYGHEAAGTVEAVGPGVTAHAPGDRVIVTLIRSCGTCPTCATGHPVHCETPYNRDTGPLTTTTGGTLSHGLNCGAFAEAVVVHASQLAPVPADMPPEAACLLACGVITGVGAAVNTARIRPGEVVAVIGAGGVGLNAVQGARIAGAAQIVALDRVPSKLDDAVAFGATAGLLSDTPDLRAAFRTATGGRMADAILVCTGAIAAYDGALALLAPGGRMVMVGMPHSGARSSYEPVIVAALGQALQGSLMGDSVLARDIRWMTDLWRQGRLKLEDLVSARFPLDRINDAIADTKAGTARRNVIVL
ncbi:MAG: Zn-dependent alcohol dehydrogenase [Rhodobacteraceae bacterium]|jgi:S-(hydroxymethyl)mycothiol dehydrogenase|nr:Zn-dependent alcohol dehydrogenase [Paracoccaceae bacterium]